ncbi:hypothetical protein EPUS_02481 [Endocarpon pusillum Z07020]|uniref:Uncharacterized protein n=1 Tax=Endocarpon pusillum (strain Z07020 / HMAS-L-300199) TaxID=1263415 RepID=U1HK53_ENDPU|nr:uncharacterized protein EPUS_02481 [Endocarpon pusillum Z07020]ERF70615.1 hypothetical protein EPUS_02481 [Endocarpon pusillum Z07020]
MSSNPSIRLTIAQGLISFSRSNTALKHPLHPVLGHCWTTSSMVSQFTISALPPTLSQNGSQLNQLRHHGHLALVLDILMPEDGFHDAFPSARRAQPAGPAAVPPSLRCRRELRLQQDPVGMHATPQN